jgi:hypothetical protein
MARTDGTPDATDERDDTDDQTRTYITVRPADDPLSPQTIERHFRQLHRIEGDDDRGLWARLLRRSPSPPTIECRLVSDGTAQTSLHYEFGVDDPSALSTLERILRGLVPNTYELERVTRPATWLDDVLDPRDEADDEGDEPTRAAVEFTGRATRRTDWQTRLTPFSEIHDSDRARIPLTAVVEAMATHPGPMVYQALLRPLPDWTDRAEGYRFAIGANQHTVGAQITNVLFGPPDDDINIPHGETVRMDELAARDTRNSFVVNARALAVETPDSDATESMRELAGAFAGVSHTTHEIEGRLKTGSPADAIARAITDRTLHPPRYERLWTRLPWTTNRSRGIVMDAAEAPSVCLLGGETLTTAGGRALAPTPGERQSIPRPPFEILRHYRGDGFPLGLPLTQDGTPAPEPVVVPTALQPLHLGLCGKSGAGKTTVGTAGTLANHEATDGATIVVEPKGDGMVTSYLQAHFATYGTLDDVVYFDCAELLPAFGFFDIRDQLDAGIPRATAVEKAVDHYIEILRQIVGREQFDQAIRSPDIIRYLVKAMFDEVNGTEAFSHRDLHTAARTMHERQAAPPVSDDDLAQMLAGVVANRPRSFDEIMQGVANRIEKIPLDRRLARVFNHVPGEDDPQFDLADYLDEDVVIIFDTGGLRSEAQRVLTLVILSNLWTALKRRAQRQPTDDPSLVNLYLEEAPSIADTDLLNELLSQGRGFGCSITLAMQFPGQLREHDDRTYDEVLNEVSTFVTGNVPFDRRLAERLATEDMDAQAVGTRLRALRRGQWLCSLPAPFDEPPPRPFLVQSAPLPPGHPEGDQPLSAVQQLAFERARAALHERTEATVGLTLTSPGVVDQPGDEDTSGDDGRLDSVLAYTRRLPDTVEYLHGKTALGCTHCGSRYDPRLAGMRRAVSCCSSLDEVDRNDIPICDVTLKLGADERAAVEWSDRQLLFLQAVYNAQQLRYDPLEYDICTDSMLRLQEYVGVDTEPVQDLIDADLLRHDTDHPHRLYTVTPDGRDVLGESYRQGVDYGHGAGDLEESSQHVFAVEVARRYLERAYAEDPDADVSEVIPYYDLDDQHRLDIAALDADGQVRVAVEAERVNHDLRRAAPDDFDKIAACDVDEAIWVVMTQSEGHDVLQALNDPLEGEPRVEKTYAATTPPQQFRIDTPGLTAMYPAEWLHGREREPGWEHE